jgi:hypothetical protein
VGGDQNNALGDRALRDNVSGFGNTGIGDDALLHSDADRNTALGNDAGNGITTGFRNVVVGDASGGIIGTGSRNIYVGDSVTGGANEVRFIRIGDTSFTDYDCFIAGIYNRAVNSALVPKVVIIDSNGKLGTLALPNGFPGNAPAAKDPAPRQDVHESEKQAMLNLKVEKLQATVGQQQKQIETLTTQLREQAAQIQKVSAQLEVNKPAPQVVNNQ